VIGQEKRLIGTVTGSQCRAISTGSSAVAIGALDLDLMV
jgi:hypothetical protein